jgi:hypothetical protein
MRTLASYAHGKFEPVLNMKTAKQYRTDDRVRH